MSKTEKKANPLFEAQRETKGAETFAKYDYQYHWALHRIFEEYIKDVEYAVIVELHEDVIISNSLDSEKARFDFNQIKNIKDALNLKALVYRKANRGNSTFGKLIQSSTGKKFSDKIDTITLVNVNGFNLEYKTTGVNLQITPLKELTDDSIAELKKAMKVELAIDDIPEKIRFVKASITELNIELTLIGFISSAINKLDPGAKYDSVNIYTSLIGELHRRGKIEYDYAKWEELLSDKAVTSEMVKSVVNVHKDTDPDIEKEFGLLLAGLNLKSMDSLEVKRAFDRYNKKRIGNRDTLQLDTTKKVVELVNKHKPTSNGDILYVTDKVINDLPDKIRNQFNNRNEMVAAIICEYLFI